MARAPYREDELEAARVRFGGMIRRWFQSGGWTTKTPAEWAKAAGLPQISNNTVSFIWRGTQPKTSPAFFTAIGYLNQRLADRDYGPLQDRGLRDRVSNLQPLRDAGGLWTAADFFAAYIGLKELPPEFDPGPAEPLPSGGGG